MVKGYGEKQKKRRRRCNGWVKMDDTIQIEMPNPESHLGGVDDETMGKEYRGKRKKGRQTDRRKGKGKSF